MYFTEESLATRHVDGSKTTRSVKIENFDSIEEAIERLGATRILQFINYAHRLNQLHHARRPEPCPKCGGQCGYWNLPLGCGK